MWTFVDGYLPTYNDKERVRERLTVHVLVEVMTISA